MMIGAPTWLLETIPGGRAAGRHPNSFDPTQLAIGTRVEFEHTFNPVIAREIAMDHLVEDPMYYQKLAKVHLDGLGITRARWTAPPSGLGITRAHWAEAPHFSQTNQGQIEGLEIFDSWWWRNRKVLVLGGLGLLGLGLLGLAGALLK